MKREGTGKAAGYHQKQEVSKKKEERLPKFQEFVLLEGVSETSTTKSRKAAGTVWKSGCSGFTERLLWAFDLDGQDQAV